MLSLAHIPLSLYVHIPWCVRKCPYCDFNSHVAKQSVDENAYIDCLLEDLAEEQASVGNRSIDSIFFGGGTPSLFSAPAISRLLDGIADIANLSSNAEITLEANPGTLEAGRYNGYRKAGVNRLSMGVQSFNDIHLSALGRIHSSSQVFKAFRAARTAGFDNINLDVMYGLPQQSLRQAMDDLDRVIELAPEHVSWYQLTLEPNTLFYQRPPQLPEEDALCDMMQPGQEKLAEAGYQQYEISAYAQKDRQCLHNRNYWQFGDYIGIGAGAHGKVSHADGRIIRRRKQRHPERYSLGEYVSGQDVLQIDDLAIEFMLNALRLNKGVPSAYFSQRTGCELSSIERQINKACELGLLSESESQIAPTERGRLYLNNLLSLFEPK